MKGRLRILLVDDQKLFVESLRQALRTFSADVDEVAIAYDGAAAVKVVEGFHPQVVLMDVHMPGMGGIEATRLIHSRWPDVKIVMLTTFGYDDYVRSALDGGAVGYLLKDISPEELLQAVKSIEGGGGVILSREIISQLSGTASIRAAARETPKWLAGLTNKERKVLLLVSKGFSNEEIADRLYLGNQTVRNYISSLYSKLGVDNRFEAMRTAIEAQINDLIGDE